MKSLISPAEYQEVAEARREMMIDAIAETDDDIMMKYLEGEEISIEELKQHCVKQLLLTNVPSSLWFFLQKTKVYKCYWMLFVDYMTSSYRHSSY